MSVEGPRWAAIPEWVLYHHDLEGLDVRVYGVLARHGGQSFPGHDRIAELVRKSHDTVARSLGRLEKVGAIVIEPRYRDDGSRTTNLYTLAGDAPMRGPLRTGAGGDDATVRGAPLRTGAGAITKAMYEREPCNDNNTSDDTPSPCLFGTAPELALRDDVPTFDAWWSSYRSMANAAGVTNYGSRGDASKAWDKLSSANRVAAIAGLARHRENVTTTSAVPHGSTWLNKRRWMDDTLLGRPAERNSFDAALGAMVFDDAGNLIR